MSGEKDNWGRADRLDMWRREGGVMIMGYDMFRNLTREHDKKFKKKQRVIFKETLTDPGPQMVICDEGHVLKNMKSALNGAMNKISTKRRIILTGKHILSNLNNQFNYGNLNFPFSAAQSSNSSNQFLLSYFDFRHSVTKQFK